jgi:hypothetical protein
MYLHCVDVCLNEASWILLLGSNDKSVMVWNLGGNLSLDSELVKPCSALSHFGNNNSEVSGWKACFIGDSLCVVQFQVHVLKMEAVRSFEMLVSNLHTT